MAEEMDLKFIQCQFESDHRYQFFINDNSKESLISMDQTLEITLLILLAIVLLGIVGKLFLPNHWLFRSNKNKDII